MGLFGGCCGFGGEMESLAPEKIESQKFSAIQSLDEYVQDWAYEKLESMLNAGTSCFNRRKLPKRKNLDIKVYWDEVHFTHGVPEELKPANSVAGEAAAAADTNGNESLPLVTRTTTSPRDGFDDRNKLEKLHQETFCVTFDNTTDDPCSTTLTSTRTVKASYEVDVHRSVQTGHNLQLSLEAGGDESPVKAEVSYEFNKMLEDYKGEKSTEEMETTLNTECPVTVKGKHTTEAKFVTTYQNFKKTLHVKSKFEGCINIDITGKKKGRNGKRFYRMLNNEAGKIFHAIVNKADSPLANMIEVDDDLVVTYKSSATFCSSFGVDTHVVLNSYPITTA